MAKEREQSPHYIPELDPDNPKRPTDIGEQFFGWLYYLIIATFFASVIVAGGAWYMGWDRVMTWAVIAAIASAVSLLPLILA